MKARQIGIPPMVKLENLVFPASGQFSQDSAQLYPIKALHIEVGGAGLADVRMQWTRDENDWSLSAWELLLRGRTYDWDQESIPDGIRGIRFASNVPGTVGQLQLVRIYTYDTYDDEGSLR